MSDQASGDPALDDDYRDLFHPPDPSSPPVSAAPDSSAGTSTGTGRLFRSVSHTGAQETAIVAIRPDQARKLRSLTAAVEPAEPPLVLEGLDETSAKRPTIRPARTPRKARGLRPGAVYVIDIVITVIFGFIDVWVRSDGLGWITGLGLLIAAVYTSLVVRPADWVVTIIAPPIAFFAAAVSAGQMDLGPSGSSLINRVAHTFFTLGSSWLWILLPIAIGFAIHLLRQRTTSPQP
jgi:hypothetical protein